MPVTSFYSSTGSAGPASDAYWQFEAVGGFATGRAAANSTFFSEGYPAGAIRAGFRSNGDGIFDRTVQNYDTSSLGSGVTVLSATMYLYVDSVNNINNQRVALVQSLHAANFGYSSSDYNISNFGSVLLSDTVLDASNAVLNSFNALPLNAAGLALINTTGVTKLALISEYDRANTPPGSNSGTLGGSGDGFQWQSTDGSPKQYLEISYTSAPTSTPASLFLLRS